MVHQASGAKNSNREPYTDQDGAVYVDLDAAGDGVRLRPWVSRPITARDRLIRLRDIALAAVGLVLCIPLLAIVALAIRLDSAGPVLFRHRRVGRYARPFDCVKLRTMVVDAPELLPKLLASDPERARQFAAKHKLKNDPRVTRIGRVLRQLNLDELPQLWNVLVGDMALVGPRPIVTEEIPRYGVTANEVLSVRPGMTGLWQVSGRSETTYAERVALDLRYVRNRTFSGDLAIMIKTLTLSLKRSNGAA